MTDLCPICKGTDIDDYGCMDCFMLSTVAQWYEDEDEQTEEDK